MDSSSPRSFRPNASFHPRPVPTGEPERASFVVPDEDGPDAFARAFGLGEPADDELLAPNALGLPPVVRARPGSVWCRAALADDPLRAEPARMGEYRPAVRVEVRGIANNGRWGVSWRRRTTALARRGRRPDMASRRSQARLAEPIHAEADLIASSATPVALR